MAEKRFPLSSGRCLVWDSGDGSHVPPDNNLRLYCSDGAVLWQMRDAVGYDDACVSLTVQDQGFSFLTFNCIRFTISLDTLQVLEKRFVK